VALTTEIIDLAAKLHSLAETVIHMARQALFLLEGIVVDLVREVILEAGVAF